MKRPFHCFLGSAIGLLAGAVPGYAQSTASAESDSESAEILVTARKREETLISVPVVVTAVSGARLEKEGISSLDSIARMVPALIIGEGGGTVSGGVISLRGISGQDANLFGDQAVSFNIDGVQVARSAVRRMAEMDLAQIEVLKGPQALFFGKNSPAGIISMRSADPTRGFRAKLSTGYEFEGREWVTNGYLSGPLAENLGGRLAFHVADMGGWVKNIAPENSITPRADNRVPNSTEYAIRGTLLFEPSDRLTVRGKLTYNKLKGSGTSANTQLLYCPLGFPQNGGPTSVDDCRADDKVAGYIAFGPSFTAAGAPLGDGEPYYRQRQILGSLEVNYDLTDNLSLASVTGYYGNNIENLSNFSSVYDPARAFPSRQLNSLKEFSQELRLSSDFDSLLNFVIGGHLHKVRAEVQTTTWLNALVPAMINNYWLKQRGTAYSVFGQLIFDPAPTFQLTAGGRYSYERKRLPLVNSGGIAFPSTIPAATPNTEDHWTDFSPEVTARWRPNQDLTLFASYKQGFLSGGFNSSATNFSANLGFDPQTIEGFEGGVKAALLERRLRVNFSLYTYKVKGLQVITSLQGILTVGNVGALRTEGGELDFTYTTPIEGLSLYGGVAYNRARYLDYVTQCYRGQTQALGCRAGVPNAAGNFAAQDLTGTQVVRAPDWTGNAGVNFDTPITAGLKLGLSGGLTFSSAYWANPTEQPSSRQSSYTLLNASVRIGAENDRWEVALIGRNLSNKYYSVRINDSVFTGSAPGGPGTTSLFGDGTGPVSRGREIMLRATLKYGD